MEREVGREKAGEGRRKGKRLGREKGGGKTICIL